MSTRKLSTLAAAIEPLESRTLFSTYFVNGFGDGAGSVTKLIGSTYNASTLRAAITAANAKADADTIIINPLLSGTVKLNSGLGELAITNDVTIQGTGANRQGVDGNGTGRVFNISAGADVTINDLTISNGLNSYTGGGGVRNLGNLTLRGVTVKNNTLILGDGAGVYNAGNVKVYNSTFSGNSTDGAGGGLFNRGTAIISGSTFANNSASVGGGLYNYSGATMLVSNSTISKNFASISGGGVAGTIDDPYTMTSGTRFNNTIISGNTFNPGNGGLGPDLYGWFDPASSNNLVGSIGFAVGLDPSKNLLGGIQHATPDIDAKLGALGNYGGPTQTMPLLAGSPALNKGNNSLILSGTWTDQRGDARIKSGIVDIGAVEGGTQPASPFGSIVILLSDVLKTFF